MNNALNAIENLICQMNPANFNSLPNQEKLEEWISMANTQYINFINGEKQSNLVPDNQCNRAEIQNAHHKLVASSNQLVSYIHTLQYNADKQIDSKTSAAISAFKVISLLVDQLVHYLIKRYRFLINHDREVPVKIKALYIRIFQHNLKNFRNCENEWRMEVLWAFAQPFIHLIKNKQAKLTYKTLVYLNTVIKQVMIVLSEEENLETGKQIEKILFLYNFNSVHFWNYFCQKIDNSIKNLDSEVERLESLCWYLKSINQVTVLPGISFNPKQVPVKEIIVNWISDEISYYEKMIRLKACTPAQLKNTLENELKILTDMSVSQLAIFIRLLVETGIIKNKNQMDVIKFYASTTQSKRTENISPESFRTKYYNIDESSREAVKHLIIHLLNHINKL